MDKVIMKEKIIKMKLDTGFGWIFKNQKNINKIKKLINGFKMKQKYIYTI